jgi:hypothetical protein
MIQQWIETKYQIDALAVRNRPHTYEINLYFDA